MDPITEDFIRRTWGEEQLAFWQQRPEIQLHQLFEQLNHQQRNGILPVEESIGPMVGLFAGGRHGVAYSGVSKSIPFLIHAAKGHPLPERVFAQRPS